MHRIKFDINEMEGITEDDKAEIQHCYDNEIEMTCDDLGDHLRVWSSADIYIADAVRVNF